MRNTHVGLHSNYSSDDLRGVPDGVEDYKNELDGKFEHAALDDDFDGSPACPCRKLRVVRREIPDAASDKGCHYHGRAQWKRESGKM